MFHVKQFFFLLFLLPFFSFAQHFGATTLPVRAMPKLPPKNILILKFLDNYSEYKSLDSAQKEWFYWTNYSRSNPKRFWDSIVSPIITAYPTLNNSFTSSLKKDLHAAGPLPSVKPNTNLLKVSETFSREMSSKNASPSHTSPSGVAFPDRMKAAGIIKCAGENISFGPSNPLIMLVLLYIDEGVPGLGHRRTLLNPTFTEMGIGISEYSDNKNSIVIQDFACTQK